MKRFAAVCGAVAAILLRVTAFAETQPAGVVAIDIAPQSLATALNEFAGQANLRIVFSMEDAKGIVADRLSGTFSRSQALSLLLANSHLGFIFVDERTVEIHAAVSGRNRDSDATKTSWDAPHGSVIRLAQSESPKGNAENSESPLKGEPIPLSKIEQVVVTGTHIRGATPVGSNVILIDREQIDRSGVTTVQDFFRSVSQNFGGGPGEETRYGGGQDNNAAASSSINLRGLGAGETLVLLNGRRMTPSGTNGSFVDVSMFPLSTIERIDVLSDGASAIYGSDAVGGVVNIQLRKRYEGAETELRWGDTTGGGGLDYGGSQVAGFAWGSGAAMLTFDYSHRDPVAARDRELTESMDLRRFGGDDYRSIFSNPGTIVIGADTYAIPAGQDGRSLNASALVRGTSNRGNISDTLNLVPERKLQTFLASLEQDVGSRLSVFLRSLYSHRESEDTSLGLPGFITIPSTNPFYKNPAGGTGPIRMRYNFGKDLGGLQIDNDVKTLFLDAGAELAVGARWSLSFGANYSREKVFQRQTNRPDVTALNAALADPNPATAFNPFGDGSFTNPATIEAIRGSLVDSSQSSLTSFDAKLSGPLVALPAGDIDVALGAETRRDQFGNTSTPGSDRTVSTGFAELRIPVVGSATARAGVQKLELSLAARYEHYSDFGSTTNPKFGLTWAPVQDLSLRGTWGKSFKAPTLADINPAATYLFFDAFPDASGVYQDVLELWLSNAELGPETARTWTAGFDWTPGVLPDFRFSATFFHIDFTNRIIIPPYGSFLTDPTLADFVHYNPTQAQREKICNNSILTGLSLSDCLSAPIAAIVDDRSQNTAVTQERGLDFDLHYTVASRVGSLTFGLSGSYLTDFRQATTRQSPLLDLRNTPLNPVDLKMLASAGLTRGAWTLSTAVRFVNGYRDVVSVPARDVGSWTTFDLQARFDVPANRGGLLDGVSAALSAQNVFDRQPPFYNNPSGIGYDPTNATIFGRIVGVTLRKRW